MCITMLSSLTLRIIAQHIVNGNDAFGFFAADLDKLVFGFYTGKVLDVCFLYAFVELFKRKSLED